MSEGAGAEATSSETCGSVAAATAAATAAPAATSAADPLAAGEAIDELLAANEDHESSKKRKYPEPGFAVERSRPAGGRGSYTITFKLKAAAFTRRGPGAVALSWIYIVEIAPGAISPMGVRKYN